MSSKNNKKTTSNRKNMTKSQRIWADYGNLIILGIVFLAVVILAIGIIIVGVIANSGTDGSAGTATSTSSTASVSNDVQADDTIHQADTNYTAFTALEQFDAPAAGDEIAVIETTLGTIKIRLFPEQVPTAVENFKGLVNEGYYDGIIFHRVIDDFMIQGGDPTGTGMGGESIWDKAFEDEFERGLYNFRGALSMANSGANTNGSQFFIVQTKNVNSSSLSSLAATGVSQEILDKYTQVGGTPHLDGAHTVFGQVFEGMDIVDAIAAVEVDSNSKPLEDVVINKATIEKYEG